MSTPLQRPCCAEEELDSYPLLSVEWVRPHSMRKMKQGVSYSGVQWPETEMLLPTTGTPSNLSVPGPGAGRSAGGVQEAAPLPSRGDLVCAWLQGVEVKSQPRRSRAEQRGRRKCDESCREGAWARVAGGSGGCWAQGYFCTIMQGKGAKLTGQ